MSTDVSVPRSRRALLTATAGGVAALAASAALPLTVAAHDADDVQKGVDNPTTDTTSITNSTADTTALAASATGTGSGLEGTSSGGAGAFAWSVSGPPGWDPANGAYTGVYGYAPASPDLGTIGVGVVGESDDVGVFGTGLVGVYAVGDFGVIAEATSANPAVLAVGQTPTSIALQVAGKVRFSRSGRATVAKGKSSKVVSLAGMTTGSHVLAMIHSNRSGRWVRAVVPASGKFTIYLNGTVTAATSVAWFVLN